MSRKVNASIAIYHPAIRPHAKKDSTVTCEVRQKGNVSIIKQREKASYNRARSPCKSFATSSYLS